MSGEILQNFDGIAAWCAGRVQRVARRSKHVISKEYLGILVGHLGVQSMCHAIADDVQVADARNKRPNDAVVVADKSNLLCEGQTSAVQCPKSRTCPRNVVPEEVLNEQVGTQNSTDQGRVTVPHRLHLGVFALKCSPSLFAPAKQFDYGCDYGVLVYFHFTAEIDTNDVRLTNSGLTSPNPQSPARLAA